MKTLFSSKTFRLAIFQAVVGGLIIFFTEMQMVGAVAIVKSFADIALRMVTEGKIGSIM